MKIIKETKNFAIIEVNRETIRRKIRFGFNIDGNYKYCLLEKNAKDNGVKFPDEIIRF
jgi:hypothetical protein